MIEFLLAPLALVLASGPTFERALAAAAELRLRAGVAVERAAEPPHATYLAADRAVSNWRAEALHDLQPRPVSAMAVLLNVERPVVTRCVKLNNYWCIKRARWNGEIGHDDEGHVGFASADQGADAAVTLLRRYYLDFGRKSALDIVRRWAPAECRGGPSLSLSVLAVRGIGQTLRARWLAAQRARTAKSAPVRVAAAGKKAASVRAAARPATGPRVSVVPLRPLPSFRVPDIAVGLGERRVTTVSAALAPAPRRRQPTPASVAAATRAKDAPAARPLQLAPPKRTAPAAVQIASATPKPAPAASCTPDEGRIRNYAARMVQGLDLGPGDDLKLFAPDGTPLPNLPRVMLAMSSVELGVLRASMELIEAAIGRAAPRQQASAALDRAEPELPAP
ncbi:MAG: hypothetical protein ACJ8DP_11500 [Microvirga sp.]